MGVNADTRLTEPSEQADSARLAGLLADMERLAGIPCVECGKVPCGHEALFTVALGFKDSPRCAVCLARGLDRPLEELREQLAGHMQHRDCFRQAWEVACRREGFAPTMRPACLWPSEISAATPQAVLDPEPLSGDIAPASVWDAGHMSCGDLVLALRIRLQSMPGGAILQVTARDPAAPEDLPAWCRLTGNRLVRGEHPDYFIRRKEK